MKKVNRAGRRTATAVLLLLSGTQAAEARWYTASSAHFTVYADASEKEVGRFAKQLELYDKALRTFTKTPDEPKSPSARVTVFLLPSQEALVKLTGKEDAAGLYVPRAGASVAFATMPSGSSAIRDGIDYSTLFHEYAHHFMLTTWPDAGFPVWFVEGFAEMLGSTVVGDDGRVTIGGVPRGTRWGLQHEAAIPAARLLTADPSVESLTNGFYSRSWLLTHYLMLGGTERATLGRYVAAIGEGVSPVEAAKVFGDPAALDKRLGMYSQRQNLPGVILRASELPTGTITVRPLTEGEAATMPVRLRSTFGVAAKDAADLAARARKLAAPFPSDAGAQLVLATAEAAAGDSAQAEAAADRVLAVDPKSIAALVVKGDAAMTVAARAGDADKARWEQIRAVLGRAIMLDREDPRPLIAFNRTYWETGQSDDPTAKDALALAQHLAPEDPALRYRTARMLVVDGDVPHSLELLRVTANDPHDTIKGRIARRLVEALSRGDLPAARAIVDATRPGRENDDLARSGSAP